MKKQLTILLCASVCGFLAFSSQTWAQQKTAKDCTAEWRADKAGFQAKGITEKAYVAGCRSGAPVTPTAAAPTPPPAMAPAAPTASTQQKTAKACREEWQANKAGYQAQGITEKAYVAGCRAGTPATPTAAAPAPIPTATPPAPTAAPQQKTAKACREEWQANKAGFQAQGITEKAYVAGCRSGTPATPTAAAPAPTSPAAAAPPAPTQSPVTAAKPAPATVPPAAGVPSSSGQFSTEAQAKASCFGDTVVWVNLTSKIYHFSGYRNYGNTKNGAYMCEKQTAAQGMRPAKNEAHP